MGAHLPRIAVSGSAGVGKTTLGAGLAERFAVPFISEGMRARLEAGLDLHRLDGDGLRALVGDLFDEMTEALAAARSTGFVADRSPLDFLAFWLYYGFAADSAASAAFAGRCEEAMADIDIVVVLPWGVIPLADDQVRSTNRWRQLHYQAVLEGLVRRRVAPGKLLLMPDDVADPAARLDWVCARTPMRTPVGQTPSNT